MNEGGTSVKRLWYITMAFPVPSEAFLSAELLALQSAGASVSVKTLRGRRGDAEEASLQQRVEHVKRDHATFGKCLRGIMVGIFHPVMTLSILAHLCFTLASKPVLLAACIRWLPRSLQLWESVRLERPSHVHLFWGHFPSMVAWLLLYSNEDVSLSMSLGAYDAEFALPISGIVARRCHGVRLIAPDRQQLLDAWEVPPERVLHLPRGIDQRLFGSHLPRPESPGNQFELISVGRLIPSKNHSFSLRVLHSLLGNGFPAHLQFCGAGPNRQSLEDQAESLGLGASVTFHGHVSHPTLAELLAKSHFLLFPSLHQTERLPNAVKEASACGCICLATPTPGIERLIAHNESGFILEADAPAHWAKRIEELAKDSERLHRFQTAARRQLGADLSLQHTARRLIDWWGIAEPHQG
ncbi:MAG: glycosyltransferase family 4 protein [Planctomycetota bacterium]